MDLVLFWVADGGGTKTDGVLADDTGNVLARVVGAPCNLTALGTDGCARNLDDLLTSLCNSAQVNRCDISHSFLALGGLDTETDRQQFAEVVSSLLKGSAAQWQVENDVLAALYSGTWGKPGIVLLAGTGSMAMALDAQGQIKRSGGWGYMIGRDPGSAFYVGQVFLAHAMREYDAGRKPDDLVELALQQVDATKPPDFMDWVESAPGSAGRVAQFAKIVDMSAAKGNPLACKILEQSAVAMVDHFWLLSPQVDFGSMSVVPVVLAGSMFKSQVYRSTVQRLLAEAGPRWQAVLPSVPPVGGSFVGALRLANCSVTAEVMERFESGLSNCSQRHGA